MPASTVAPAVAPAATLPSATLQAGTPEGALFPSLEAMTNFSTRFFLWAFCGVSPFPASRSPRIRTTSAGVYAYIRNPLEGAYPGVTKDKKLL